MSRPAIHRLMARVPRVLEQETDIPSPCSSVCTMDARSGWCQGCLRTLDEIAQWASMDDARKRAVWARIGQRTKQTDV